MTTKWEEHPDWQPSWLCGRFSDSIQNQGNSSFYSFKQSHSDEMGPVLLIVLLPCLQDTKSTFAESAMQMAEKTERRD